jgi:hypothetical protein
MAFSRKLVENENEGKTLRIICTRALNMQQSCSRQWTFRLTKHVVAIFLQKVVLWWIKFSWKLSEYCLGCNAGSRKSWSLQQSRPLKFCLFLLSKKSRNHKLENRKSYKYIISHPQNVKCVRSTNVGLCYQFIDTQFRFVRCDEWQMAVGWRVIKNEFDVHRTN